MIEFHLINFNYLLLLLVLALPELPPQRYLGIVFTEALVPGIKCFIFCQLVLLWFHSFSYLFICLGFGTGEFIAGAKSAILIQSALHFFKAFFLCCPQAYPRCTGHSNSIQHFISTSFIVLNFILICNILGSVLCVLIFTLLS